MSRLASAALRAGLAAASLVVALALLELGVRWLAPAARRQALPRELVITDELLGWRLAASRRVRHRSQYFDTGYSTNTLGYRDGPRSPAASRAYRVLLYGDSQIFGWGLPAEQRFSNLVEAAGSDLEVWNLAVPGYGLDQQALSYERDGGAWHADAVVLFVSRFTQERLHYDYLFGFHKPSFRPAGEGRLDLRSPAGRLPRRFLYGLPGWMHAPYFIDGLLSRADRRWRTGRVVPKEESAALLAAVLELTSRVGSRRGQAVYVVSTLRSERQEALRRMCAGLEIGYLELGLPAEQDGLVWGPYDAHWNAGANLRIAESLGPQLEPAAARHHSFAAPR